MTLRLMGGAIHANVDSIPAKGLALAAGYVTGTSDIMWTQQDWDRFPGEVHVTIDQGFGAHVPTANIRDVEPGAWSAVDAVREPWTAARPTIYCDRNDLPAVLAAGWRGDLALAIPEPEPDLPPTVPGCTVVAVQFRFLPTWQMWVVFDEYWPAKPPVVVPGGHNRIVASGVHTVGQIAGRYAVTVPELVTSTVETQREKVGPLDVGQRELLDRLTHVHPLPGTVLWT